MPYLSRYYFATIDCVADEGVGPEDFEDPEDFVELGKQPFDHVYETPFYACHMAFLLLASSHDKMVITWGGLPPLLFSLTLA